MGEIDVNELLKFGAGGGMIYIAVKLLIPVIRTFAEKANANNEAESGLVIALTRERNHLVEQLEKKQDALNQMTQSFYQMEAKLQIMQESLDRANQQIASLQNTVTELSKNATQQHPGG